MNGYKSFLIEERNNWPYAAGPQFRLTACNLEGVNQGCVGDTLDEALAMIREKVEARLRQARAEAAGWERQLQELESYYPPAETPTEALARHRGDIVAAIKRYKLDASPLRRAFGPLGMNCGYMDSKGLIVFSLPEYDSISFRFLDVDVATLKAMVLEAGFSEPLTTWNGEGHHSMSVRLPVASFASAECQPA